MRRKQFRVAFVSHSAAVTNTHNPLFTVHHHENQPRCSHPEPEVKVHSEPEEGRLQDIHLSHQRQPG